MLILHISDLHCETHQLEKLASTGFIKRADLVVFTGDSECDGEVVELLFNAGKRVFFVPGNMDDIAVAKAFERMDMNIDGRVVKFNGYTFAGIGGISFMSSLESVKRRLREAPAHALIVVSHHPPKNGVTDKAKIGVSAGLVELRRFVEEYRPLIHLHGHIHEAPGFTVLGETLVVNPGPLKRGRFALIEVETRKVELLSLY